MIAREVTAAVVATVAENCAMRTSRGLKRSAVYVRYFPMQKLEKMTPSRSSEVNSPVISFSAF